MSNLHKKPKIKIVRESKRPVYDREKANHGVLRRTFFIMFLCGVVLFLPLIYQLFRLMVLEHNRYEASAINNQTRSTIITADRGTIYDRNMKKLAFSTTVDLLVRFSLRSVNRAK